MKDIQDIWQFFENLNEYVYAAEIETNELVYMNRKTLDAFGFHSVDDIQGKKCYEVIQNSSVPCGMCNNDKLCSGKFEEWRYYNPVIDKYMIVKDTLVEDAETGKRYRVEFSIDISEERAQDKRIQKYRAMEAVVNEGLRVALAADTPDETIQIILEHLGKVLNAERTYIFEKNAQGCDDNTYEWTAPGIMPEKNHLQNLPPEVCANWYQLFSEGEIVLITDLEEIREKDPLQYENLKRQGIRSVVVLPLYDRGNIIAFYGADNPPCDSLQYTSSMLRIMGYFLVSCIKRRNLMQKLMDMSYKDPMTGLGNRFALSVFVDEMDKEAGLGVIYGDITSLKCVNDCEGHVAGDHLILRACGCLIEVFDGYGIFRMGGDELLVLCPGIAAEDLEERIAKLHTLMEERSVNMAIGSLWSAQAVTDLDAFLREAEKQMYENKAEYYRKHGIDRRRR